jgi:transposase
MSTKTKSAHASQKRYPPELRERAVRMVQQAVAEAGGDRYGVVTRVARQLGVGSESLRSWVRQAESNSTGTGSTSAVSEDRRRIAELERELRETRRANEILKAASAFFARELDPRLPK